MIPSIFARSVEKDIWVLGICADYLEDHGIDGSILRIIADNYFLLDDSGFCDSIANSSGHGSGYGYGDGYGYGSGNGTGFCYGYGTGYGSGYVYGNRLNGNGRGIW